MRNDVVVLVIQVDELKAVVCCCQAIDLDPLEACACRVQFSIFRTVSYYVSTTFAHTNNFYLLKHFRMV